MNIWRGRLAQDHAKDPNLQVPTEGVLDSLKVTVLAFVKLGYRKKRFYITFKL
jgi:hypothetical protein